MDAEVHDLASRDLLTLEDIAQVVACRTPSPPPYSPERLAAVGVAAPFLAYLREGWPDLFTTERD